MSGKVGVRRAAAWLGRGAGLLLLLLLVAVLLAFIDWQPDGSGGGAPGVAGVGARVVAPWQAPIDAAEVRAGFARVRLNPPPDCPLGGYAARHGAAADSLLDPVGITAMVVRGGGWEGDAGEGGGRGSTSVAIAAVDLVLIPESLRAAVVDRVGGDYASFWLVATHDHAGPGGYWDNALAEVAGIGAYDGQWAAALADSIAVAVERAAEGLVPATLEWGWSEAASSLATPRSNKDLRRQVPLYALRASERSPRAAVLGAMGGAVGGDAVGGDAVGEAAGKERVLGGMVVHAAHPTILSHRSRLLSGEWPGECRRRLEERCGGEWLVVQGPSGDLKPLLPDSLAGAAVAGDWGVGEMRAYGAAVGDLVVHLPWRHLDMAEWAGAEVVMPAPRADATGIVAPLWRTPVANALFPFTRDPQRVAALRLGDLVLVGIPGEPVRAVAATMAANVRACIPEARPIVVGLVGGYVGYAESAPAVLARRGESAEVYFGPGFAARLSAAVAMAAAAMAPASSVSEIG